jgi:trans-2,3-dihydro-3-hydroxyanthranilate isomerase
MSGLTFHIVDVFAQEKYEGNQLAVVENASKLTTEQMQRIANEMHFSETTFIRSRKKNEDGFGVRIFTPSMEVPFAGHPTLGTAYVIKHFLTSTVAEEIVLNLKVGKIPVAFEKTNAGEEILWMTQTPPVFGKKFQTKQFTSLLGLQELDFERKFPIQEVSTGISFVIVPLKTLDAVKRALVNSEEQRKFARECQAGILVFCPQTCSKGNDLHVRVFVDAFGIPEDPATGSGNGCLAAYLSRHRYFGKSAVIARVEQGFEMGRPSLLHLRAQKEGDAIRVQVGGRVVLVAKGKLL